MDKQSMWKWLVLAVLVAASLSRVVPWEDKVRFGLDLRGGISFLCAVDREQMEADIRREAAAAADAGELVTEDQIRRDVDDAMRGAQARAVEVLRNRLDGLGIEEPSIVSRGDRIEIQLPGIDEDQREQAEQSILAVGVLQFRIAHAESFELTDRLMREGRAPRGFRIVSMAGGRFYVPTDEVPAAERDAAYFRELGRFEIPDPRYEFMLERRDVDGQIVYRPYFVNREALLRGEHLRNAAPTTDQWGAPAVSIEFTAAGASTFGRVTERYAPGGPGNPDPQGSRFLCIIIDNTLYSAPRINEPIYGGSAQITGDFSMTDATRLVNVLRSGALPTRVMIVDTRFVAPSLGADSIAGGFKAILLGGILTLVFMALYYKVCGLVADTALILNLVLLPLGMIITAGFLSMGRGTGGAIQLPVLTLPGIAGILLTIGMAVDANVLIFERIREELRTGKKLWTAINAGYDRAFVTILDANLTTLMVGVILFVLGTGPIRGFAVTLCAGILVSMYTALVVTRLFFGLINRYTKLKTLHMLSVVKDTTIDFVAMRKPAATVSLAVIVVSVGLLGIRAIRDPGAAFGVDFTGGTSIAFSFESGQQAPIEAVRAALADAGVDRAGIQYQRSLDSVEPNSLQIRVGDGRVGERRVGEVVREALATSFPEAAYGVVSVEEVGAQVGSELKRSAVYAIAAAMLAIILYLSWRFELGFAIGAIVALSHDVLVTVGLFSLFGQQIDLPIVAALLTIVGYSVNDTIVVFDRIREDLRLDRRKGFKEICNLSINQTLGRTLLTSVTTLITVVMLLIFGGGAIFGFALALCIGVLVGTYSSIFIATPVVLLWYRDRKPELGSTQPKVA